eukprot:PhF_6_TR22532/c1_g1_i2/m.32002
MEKYAICCQKALTRSKSKKTRTKPFFVQSLSMPQVKFEDDLNRHMEEGTERRRVASTDLNADSSRSHSVFTIYIESIETSEDGVTKSITSKLNLVDLAGSERQSKTGAIGDTLKEGCNINLSLSALGTVIDTIVKGKGHIPYRSSPLTMLLKDSLGGNSKTIMFANIGPAEHNISETVSTLRFADRAKQIKNKPVVMMDSKDQKIAELQDTVNELKEKLKKFEEGGFEDMEQENTTLKEKLGEIEIALDEAQQESQRIIEDSQRQMQAIQRELEVSKKEFDELQTNYTVLEEEKSLAEQQAGDEANQRSEIMNVLIQYGQSRGLHANSTVSDIQSMLQTLSSSVVNSEESHASNTRIAELLHELKLLQDTLSAKDSDLQRAARAKDQLEAELDQAMARMEKMKGRIEKDKEIKKANQQEYANTIDILKQQHLHEIQQMRSHLEQLERQGSFANPLRRSSQDNLTSTLAAVTAHQEEMKNLQASLQQEKEAHKADVERLQQEINAMTSTILIPVVSEDKITPEMVSQIQSALAAKTATLNALTTEMESLRSQLLTTQQQLREAKHSAPTPSTPLTSAVHRLNSIQNEQGSERKSPNKQEQQQPVNPSPTKSNTQDQSTAQEITSQHTPQKPKPLQQDPQQPNNANVSQPTEVTSPLKEVPPLIPSEAPVLAPKIHAQRTEQEPQQPTQQPPQQPLPGSSNKNGEEDMTTVESPGVDESATAALLEHLSKEVDSKTTQIDGLQLEIQKLQSVLQQTSSALEDERSEHSNELDTLRAELQQSKSKIENVQEEHIRALNELSDIKSEKRTLQDKCYSYINDCEQIKHDMEAMKKEYESSFAAVQAAQSMVHEKEKQLETTRTMLKKQKDIIASHQKRESELSALIERMKQTQEDLQKQHYDELHEMEANMQKQTNRKMEDLAEQHKVTLARRDEAQEKLKKKIRKLQSQLQKEKENYDQKVCEYEEVWTRLEEAKVESMRRFRDEETTIIDNHNEKINAVLQRAKEEKAKKWDISSGPAPVSDSMKPVAAAGLFAARLLGTVRPTDVTGVARKPSAGGDHPSNTSSQSAPPVLPNRRTSINKM